MNPIILKKTSCKKKEKALKKILMNMSFGDNNEFETEPDEIKNELNGVIEKKKKATYENQTKIEANIDRTVEIIIGFVKEKDEWLEEKEKLLSEKKEWIAERERLIEEKNRLSNEIANLKNGFKVANTCKICKVDGGELLHTQ